MKKSTIIISLVLSVITLLYIILDYCGYIRYIKLHLFSTEHYLKNYKNLEKADKNRVIVSFSLPLVVGSLKPFINSLLDQSVRVDDIIINIKDSGSIDTSFLKTLETDYKKVLTINKYKKDYDDASNLICSVLREPETNTKIILVDPGIVYGKDFIQDLVDKSIKEPDKIIYGNSGKKLKDGILVKPGFFDNKISDYSKGSGCYKWIANCSSKECDFAGYNESL